MTPPEYYLSNYSNSYAQRNNKFIFLASTTNKPAELYSLNNGSVTQLTFHNEDFINEKSIEQKVSSISLKSLIGLDILECMMAQATINPQKNTTSTRIHGGPVSQYGLSFRFDWQLFASNDYIVIAVNPL